jgi:hypothetical protein
MGRAATALPASRPATLTRENAKKSPALGGNSYSFAARMSAIVQTAAGNYICIAGITPHPRTERRHRALLAATGSVVPLRHTGNEFATMLRGRDAYLLALYRTAHPKSRADEVIAYLMNNQLVPRLISRKVLSAAETRLGMSTKRGSTSAYQADLPINVLRHENYFSQPPPLGINGFPRLRIVDIDESGWYLESACRKYGKARIGRRAPDVGPYGHSRKHTMIAGIMPCGRRWMRISRDSGTTAIDFNNFVNSICVAMGAAPGAPQLCFTWDNLTSHLSPLVVNTVTAHGHLSVPRAPYHPWDGPIEYIFNRIDQGLQTLLHLIHSEADLYHYIRLIFGTLDQFDATFAHCGI